MSHEAKRGGVKQPWKVKWTYLFCQIDLGVRYASVHPYPSDIKHCSGCISMSFFCDTLMPTNVWRPHLVSCSCSTGDPVWLGSFHPTLSLSPPSSRSWPLVTFSPQPSVNDVASFSSIYDKKRNTCCVRLLWCHMRLFWGASSHLLFCNMQEKTSQRAS